jgi:hypothetical protein
MGCINIKGIKRNSKINPLRTQKSSREYTFAAGDFVVQQAGKIRDDYEWVSLLGKGK